MNILHLAPSWLRCMATDAQQALAMSTSLQQIKMVNTRVFQTGVYFTLTLSYWASAVHHRCCEVMKNLQLWVGILELNDQDSYVPVSTEEKKGVKTGGVYVLQQQVNSCP